MLFIPRTVEQAVPIEMFWMITVQSLKLSRKTTAPGNLRLYDLIYKRNKPS